MERAPSFAAPIPGQSLTAEPGARPWQNPPQFNTIEDAAEFYIERISTPEIYDQIVDVIEMGYPLVTLANSFTLGGVMTGKHSVDVAILATPIVTEWLRGMAEDAGIEYKIGIEPETNKANQNDDSVLITRAMQEVFDKNKDKEVMDTEIEEEEPQEEMEEESLMGRRG